MRNRRILRTPYGNRIATILTTLVVALAPLPARAASVPAGFTETLVANGLSSPTAMQFAPDGRLFVCRAGWPLASHQRRSCSFSLPF